MNDIEDKVLLSISYRDSASGGITLIQWISQVQCRLVHILHPRSLIRVGYAIARAWVSGIGLLPVGERYRDGEASIRGGRRCERRGETAGPDRPM